MEDDLKLKWPTSSPFTEEIYQEWDQLVLANGYKLAYSERRERWQALYERTFIDGRWVVGGYEVFLVASLGVTLALQAKEYRFAREVCRSVLAQPCDDRVFMVHFLVREGTAAMLGGDVEEGVAVWRALVKTTPNDTTLRVQMLGDLIGMIEEGEGEDQPSAHIRELASLVLAEFPRTKRRGIRALAASTNRELLDLLLDCPRPRR